MRVRPVVGGRAGLQRIPVPEAAEQVQEAGGRDRRERSDIRGVPPSEPRSDRAVYHGHHDLRDLVLPPGLLLRQHLDGHGGPYGVEFPSKHRPRTSQQRECTPLLDFQAGRGLGSRWSCLYDGLRARRLHNGHPGAGGRNCSAHISDQEKRHPHHRHLGRRGPSWTKPMSNRRRRHKPRRNVNERRTTARSGDRTGERMGSIEWKRALSILERNYRLRTRIASWNWWRSRWTRPSMVPCSCKVHADHDRERSPS